MVGVAGGLLRARHFVGYVLDALDARLDEPVGAFGSDCADRNRLGPVALERARRHYDLDFHPAHTWFIGDTHHDIHAARACGARVLAVATGSYSREYLQEFLPDHCLEHLEEAEEVLRCLLAP